MLRRLIYEKDRLDPVDPSAKSVLDQNPLNRFPEGYRHLAYLQTKIGYKVKPDMPGLEGPELDSLYALRGALVDRAIANGEKRMGPNYSLPSGAKIPRPQQTPTEPKNRT